MAYLFPDPGAVTFLIEQSSLTLGAAAVPFSINCWFKTSTLAATRQFIQIGTATTNFRRIGINSSNQVVAQCSTGTLRTSTAGTFTSGAWSMATGVFSATNNRLAYTNAVAGTANTNTVTNAQPTILTVGGSQGNPNANDINLAEVAIWDVALTAADITALYDGHRATQVRPDNLIVYMPLVRAPTGSAGTNVHFNYVGPDISDNALNDVNATTTDHARRYG